MRPIALLALTSGLLAGCVSSETVTLARGAERVQCGPYELFGNVNAAAENVQIRLRDCVADYQRQGFERVSGQPQ